MTIASATAALTAALASGDAAAIRKARRALATAKKAEETKKMKKAKKAEEVETAEQAEETDAEPEDAKYSEDAQEHEEPDGDEEPVESEDAEAEDADGDECAEESEDMEDADAEEGEESEDAESEEAPKKMKKAKKMAGKKMAEDDAKTPFDKAVRSLLGATSNAAALGKLRAMIDAHAQLDGLAKKVAKMEHDAKKASVEKLVASAVRAGKIAPTQSDMFVRMGMRDSRELKAYVETAPAIVSTAHAVESPKHVPGAAAVSDRASRILAEMGVSPEKAKERADKRGIVFKFPTT